MRLTVAVLGAELFSIELCRDVSEVDDDTGAASGGQFELGFRPPRPVLPGEECD